ncbi:MAG: hypothetical protein GY906_38790, partial [bacterium]|nr:hypothetical protein [bacterium]
MKKICLTSAEQLLRDFEEFEAQLQRCEVNSWKRWYEYFLRALEPSARSLVDSFLLDGLGGRLMRECKQTDQEDSWATLYRMSRSELLTACGVGYETSGELAEKRWSAISFPADPTFEQIQNVLVELADARIQMYRTGQFTAATWERELASLKKKLPLGSNLRQMVLNRDYQVSSYRQFTDLVCRYQHNLQRRKKAAEPGNLGQESRGADTGAGELTDISDLEDDETEFIGRVRDAGLAAGGLANGPRGGGNDGRKNVDFRAIDRCKTCGGRHRDKVCPNSVAKG